MTCLILMVLELFLPLDFKKHFLELFHVTISEKIVKFRNIINPWKILDIDIYFQGNCLCRKIVLTKNILRIWVKIRVFILTIGIMHSLPKPIYCQFAPSVSVTFKHNH